MMLAIGSSPKRYYGQTRKGWGRLLAYALGALFSEFVKGALGR
ncbi:hypothetical protein ACX93W_12485 [Paenibacillus sp. CAU 1782]